MPWSLRQTGVYQQFHKTTSRGRFILIQPSKDVQRRMQEEFVENENYSNFSDHWFALHLLCLSTLSGNWISYLKFLERHIAAIVSSCFTTKTYFSFLNLSVAKTVYKPSQCSKTQFNSRNSRWSKMAMLLS